MSKGISFRELIGAVVVGTIGSKHRQPVGVIIGTHQVICGCLEAVGELGA